MEIKELYIAPQAQILCFKASERLASWGDGIVGGGDDDDDVTFEAGTSGGESEDYE